MGKFYEDNKPVIVGLLTASAAVALAVSFDTIYKLKYQTTAPTFEARDVTGDGIKDFVLGDGTNRVLVANRNGLYEMTTTKVQDGRSFLVDQQGGFYDLKGNYFPLCVNRGGECPPPIKK